MALVKAYEDMVVLKPREDLDRAWASDTIYTPDNALTSSGSMSGLRFDTAAVCEVMHIGPGSEECPDLQQVAVGDVVALPLYGASKVLITDGEMCLLTRFNGLAAVVRNLGKATESIQAINDYVLTRRAREDFERIMHGRLIMPDTFLDDGFPVDEGYEGIVRVVLERVASVGGGHWEKYKNDQVKLNPKLWKPSQVNGELVGFNPLASCRFRRFGVWYRLTPFEDIQFSLPEE